MKRVWEKLGFGFVLALLLAAMFCVGACAEEEELIITREIPDNILMEQTGDLDGDPVFGNEGIAHGEVTSVTFLDTLADMPGTAWDVSLNGDGSVMAWMDNGALYIAGEGGVTASSCKRMFSGFYEVTSINFNDCFYTDIAQNMRQMFQRCWKLPELDVSSFRTANVTDMGGMFVECEILTELDVSSFDTSRVIDMGDMFYECKGLTALDLSNFDTSSCVSMGSMFYDCTNLAELDISSFDTSKVRMMDMMFIRTPLKSLDLSHFDTSSVVYLDQMFIDCTNLETLDISSFRTPKCETFHCMFEGCSKLTTLDLSGFDFSNARKAQKMFMGCTNLTDINRTIALPAGCLADDMYTGSGLK